MTILLRCRLCKGTGEIPNDQFRICQALKSPITKKYFHIPMEDEIGADNDITPDACNGVSETVQCPVCGGGGTISFDEDDWELQIIADEDDFAEV